MSFTYSTGIFLIYLNKSPPVVPIWNKNFTINQIHVILKYLLSIIIFLKTFTLWDWGFPTHFPFLQFLYPSILKEGDFIHRFTLLFSPLPFLVSLLFYSLNMYLLCYTFILLSWHTFSPDIYIPSILALWIFLHWPWAESLKFPSIFWLFTKDPLIPNFNYFSFILCTQVLVLLAINYCWSLPNCPHSMNPLLPNPLFYEVLA